jgi:predicted ribosomally synthesized peptide with SipW-like signal peptide
MQFSRPLVLALGGAAVAGLALIGVGAGATFTSSTTSSQQITAGTMHLAAWSASTPGCASAADDCQVLTFAAFGPTGSTFLTNNALVHVKNTGNIPMTFDAFQMSETDNGSAASQALLAQTDVCIESTDPSGTWVEARGPLAAAVGLNPTVKENPVVVQPGDEVTYQVNFYAGQDACTTSSAGIVNSYSDGSQTRQHWHDYLGGDYQAPASLTNAAQGGVITPKLTFSVTG